MGPKFSDRCPYKKRQGGDFPGSPVVKTSTAGGMAVISGRGTKILNVHSVAKKKCGQKLNEINDKDSEAYRGDDHVKTKPSEIKTPMTITQQGDQRHMLSRRGPLR